MDIGVGMEFKAEDINVDTCLRINASLVDASDNTTGTRNVNYNLVPTIISKLP